jgi:hypothetical protein
VYPNIAITQDAFSRLSPGIEKKEVMEKGEGSRAVAAVRRLVSRRSASALLPDRPDQLGLAHLGRPVDAEPRGAAP